MSFLEIAANIDKYMAHITIWSFLSSVFGFIYLMTWGMSLYPQAWENYKRKNVVGYSFELAILNPFAYFFYTIYTFSGRIYSDIGTGKVSLADVLFSSHGVLLTSIHLT